MTAIAANAHGRGSLAPLILRTALRNLRGGLRGFGIFLACVILGVTAITGVGSVARGLADGLARQGRTILGGDMSFALIHRELSSQENAYLQGRGRVSAIATLRAMARRADGSTALVEIKAVGADYPTVGAAETKPAMPLAQALDQRGGVFGVVVDPALLARLDLKVGDRIFIGQTPLEIRAALGAEPDKLAGGIGFGPRVMMSLDALNATALVQPGSLVRRIYRLALPAGAGEDEAALNALGEAANKAFPQAGWEVRTRTNVSPQFSKNLQRFTQFLTLVGLTALIVGGVGVANAVHAFVDRRRGTIATLKAIGATSAWVFGLMLAEVMLVAAVGILAGMALGAAMPFFIVAAFGALIPFPITAAVYPGELAAGAFYGALTALTFALLPLGRTHDIPVSALFRDHIEPARRWPRPRYLAMVAAAAVTLAGGAILLAYDKKLAAYYTVAIVIAFVLLRGVAAGVMALARLLPRSRHVEWRLAITNVYRPGALTPSVVLSLGLGLALLVALVLIEGNIRAQLQQARPGETPSFFFIDVQGAQASAFAAFLKGRASDAKIDQVPMMRGRIVMLNDVRAETVKAKDSVAWVLEGDRGITYARDLPKGTRLAAGAWWAPDYAGPPLVSLDKEVAEGLGLKLGDTLTVNVLGRNLTAGIANLRIVDWRSFGINFVMVFSPNTFAGAPHAELATLTFPHGADPLRETTLLKQVAAAYPAVTSVRVKDALDTLNGLLGQLGFAIRGAASVALVTSILVLAGAIAAGRRARTYDAVVLKTLGATRARLLAAFVIEYTVIGCATALFGVLAGGAAAWFIVTGTMQLDFVWLWGAALSAALGALALTVFLGLLGTWRILGRKPAAYLSGL